MNTSITNDDKSNSSSLFRHPSLSKKVLSALLAFLLAFLCVTPLAGCTSKPDYGQYTAEPGSEYQAAQTDSDHSDSSSASSSSSGSTTNSSDSSSSESSSTTEGPVSVSAEQGEQPSLAEIPEFEGDPYIEVNYNEPSFTEVILSWTTKVVVVPHLPLLGKKLCPPKNAKASVK